MARISPLESAIHSILSSLNVPRNRQKAMLLLFNDSERNELLEQCRLWLIGMDKERHKKSGEKNRLEPRMTPPLEGVPKKVIVEAYADREKMSLRRAMLSIAKRLELVSQTDWILLDHDLRSEETCKESPSDKPEFRSDGTLLFRGVIIKKFRITRTKSRLIRVLEMLEQSGWEAEIKNTVFRNRKSLPDIADRLRSSTSGILTFSGSEATNTISWRAL